MNPIAMFATIHVRKVCLAGILLSVASGVLAGGSLFIASDDGQTVEIRWDDRMLPASFVLSSQGYVGSAISTSELAIEIEAALGQYNVIPESRIELTFDGEVELNDSGGESVVGAGVDGTNLITFNDPDLAFGPGVAAVCAQTVTAAELVIDDENNDLNNDGVADLPNGTFPAGTVLDADIVFNGNVALSVSGDDGTADVRSLALHEIGHCIGLSHSSVRNAVMFPFQSADVASARVLKEDDVAHAASLYPETPDYDSQYGQVEGRVMSGITGQPVVGAHVYVADATTREAVVGAYSGRDGRYSIPVRSDSYFVGIEPLDGNPAGLDPERINTVISDTTDVFFPEEYFDSAESSIDAPEDAELVPVSTGVATTGINIVTNTVDIVSSSLLIGRGVNYVSYPVAVPLGISAFDLLTELSQSTQVQSIQRLNTRTGRFETAHLVDGVARGYDFPISRSAGYIVHSSSDEQLNFDGSPDCPAFDLVVGTNLIAAPCAPAGYSAYDLLADIGTELDVERVQSYDRETGTWISAQYAGPDPAGADFPIEDGGAYLIDMRVDVDDFRINASDADFPPVLLSVSPGEAVPGAIVTLKGTGFAEDVGQNVVLFNDVAAEIVTGTTQQLVVRVPANAESGTVQAISAGLAGNALPFEVLPPSLIEVEGVINDIASGQTITGNLDDENDSDDYRFLAIEGNRITVRVQTSMPGVPELSVTLIGPLGGPLAVATNGDGQTATIRDFVAADTGFHTINVRSKSGSGPYTLELSLEGTPGEPRLLAIQGDYQTGVMGTELPVPLQIVAVDETGLPASGVPISFAVSPVGQQNASGIAANAQSTDPTRAMTSGDMTTLTSGVLTVAVELPDGVTGNFNITVTAPFRTSRPVTLLVSSIPRPIDTVQKTPADEYACADGEGCPVGEVVDIPYELVFRDSDGNAIENVFVEWAVVSGGGEVIDESGTGARKVRTTSDADGRVAVNHRIGERVYFPGILAVDDPTNRFFDPFAEHVTLPHQVVATVPGQPFPALFNARARAGAPTVVRSLRARSQRASVGAATLGIVTFFVTDQFGNPVEGATVTPGPLPPGVIAVAGFVNGNIFTGTDTDSNGIWSTGIGVLDDGSLVSPTINEFREIIAEPISITFSVGGGTTEYLLDIDMGPYAVSTGIGSSALIGQPLPASPELQFRRFQRVDEFIEGGSGEDDDGGDWEDEAYGEIREIVIAGIPVSTSIRRLDGNTSLMQQLGIPTTLINGETTFTSATDGQGRLTFNDVRVGGVFGAINLISDVGTQDVEFYRDGAVEPYRTDVFEFAQGILPIFARPLMLTIDLEDPVPADPSAPRVYPGIGLSSGIHVGELAVRVNDFPTLSTARTGSMFPFFARLSYDGQDAARLDHNAEKLRPGTVRLVFHPSSDLLISGDTNTVVISQFVDDVGNIGVASNPADDQDQQTETITFEFDYP